MYLVNDVALDNDAYGWSIQASSEPYGAITRRNVELTIGTRSGSVPVYAGEDSPVIALTIRAPADTLGALLALLDAQTVKLGKEDGMTAPVEVLTATPRLIAGDPELGADVVAVFRFYDLFWRDAETTETTNLGAASVPVEVLRGLQGPVRDAIVRVAGSTTGLVVTDSGGSWFKYAPNVPAGSFLRFHSDTGRAFVTATNTWTGGTEVTGLVENGPGPYPFQIVPSFTDPGNRVGVLTVTSTARTGSSQIIVKGRRAYRI